MFCASYVYLFNLCWTGFTSPQPIVGRVYPSTLAFYPSKGRVDGSLDEAVPDFIIDGSSPLSCDTSHLLRCSISPLSGPYPLHPSTLSSVFFFFFRVVLLFVYKCQITLIVFLALYFTLPSAHSICYCY